MVITTVKEGWDWDLGVGLPAFTVSDRSVWSRCGLTGLSDRDDAVDRPARCVRLVDQARCLVRVPSYRPRVARCFLPLTTAVKGIPDALTQFPHPIPWSCNNSIASTGPHQTFTINSATYFIGRNTSNVCRTFKATIWYGLLNIWTRYVAAFHFFVLRLSQPSLSMASIPPVPLPVSAYASSETYAALGGYSQHHTRFHLTFSILVPSRSPQEIMVTCTRESSMVQGFALNVCGFILKVVRKRLSKCATDAVAFPVYHTHETHRPFSKKSSCGNA